MLHASRREVVKWTFLLCPCFVRKLLHDAVFGQQWVNLLSLALQTQHRLLKSGLNHMHKKNLLHIRSRFRFNFENENKIGRKGLQL